MKKILVALDFTPASKNAFEYAIQIAQKLQASLTVLHVTFPISSHGMYPDEMIEFAKENEKTRAVTHLKKLTTYYPNKDGSKLIKHNVQINYQIKEGITVSSIIQNAKELKADLILLGTKERNDLLKIIFGNVVSELIKKTPVPVLLIPENCRFQAVKNIAFATELKGKDKSAILWLRQFGEYLKASVNPFFINQLPSDFSDVEEEEWVSNSLPAENEMASTVTVIRNKFILAGIDSYLKKYPSEILAMFIPEWKFFNQLFHISNTQKMVTKTNIPLLIYRAT